MMEPGHPPETGEGEAIRETLSGIAQKWSILVIIALGGEPRRFNALRKALGVSQKMLSSTLRILERDGFVCRTVYPTVPPQVDYRLTDLGRDVLVPLRQLGEWARNNGAQVQQARGRFADSGEDE